MKFQEFSCVYDFHRAFPTEELCVEYLERLRWNGVVVSPFSETSKVYKCLGGKYKCKDTKKYFTVRTGTIFANSNLPLSKWVLAIYLFTTHGKGLSSVQLAKDLGIRQKAAWFVLHRIRFAMSKKSLFDAPLRGIIESDTCFIGGKDGNKHAVKRIHLSEDKAPVIGMVARGGNVIMKHISQHSSRVVVPILASHISPGSELMTDEGHEFAGAYHFFNHHTIVHSKKEYVHGHVYTNTMEGIWSQLKRGLLGTYHFASKKHLQAYLDEYAYRYNNRQKSLYAAFNHTLEKSVTVSLKWKDLVGKGPIA